MIIIHIGLPKNIFIQVNKYFGDAPPYTSTLSLSPVPSPINPTFSFGFIYTYFCVIIYIYNFMYL